MNRYLPFPAGSTRSAGFCVTEEEMLAFRGLSGDDNPLHSDPLYARRCGFDGPVVYGGLIVAQISRLLGTQLPGFGCIWRSVSLRFRSPLYVGQHAQLHALVTYANEDLRLLNLKLRVEAGGRRVAEGEATAQRAPEFESVDA